MSSTPTATPTLSPSPSSALVTELRGHLSLAHPVAWRLVDGPPLVVEPSGPRLYSDATLFYLSNAPLTLSPCPVFPSCPMPLSALPPGGVLVSFSPNPGFEEAIPPPISVDAPGASCRAVGGEAEVYAATAGTVVLACLRGPDLALSEAEVRNMINSLELAP